MLQIDGTIAYFSMEIALEPGMPTYSGGLGVLAGDTLRTAADIGLPMVGVSLIHRKGYFFQHMDRDGRQVEEPCRWSLDEYVRERPERVRVPLNGRSIELRAWRRDLQGVRGDVVPVYFLDSDLESNSPEDRALTDSLYGGDDRYRLAQEALLGIGGVRMLRALGHEPIRRYHLNEGHSSLLTLALLDEAPEDGLERIRERCVFTTHTPIPAGHDAFELGVARDVLGRPELFERPDLRQVFTFEEKFNLTHTALHMSRYVNGVARRHGEISRTMFPGYPVASITNGVHCATWATQPFRELFDAKIPDWRENNFSLRYASYLETREIWEAHRKAKHKLLDYVNQRANAGMDSDVFTIGWGRRFTAYKQPDLLFRDLDRLRRIASEIGPLQVVYAGKAHPKDVKGKELIRQVVGTGAKLGRNLRFAYLHNYDMTSGGLMCGGVDLWLNTPRPPLEASGTSGMKAALNAVPTLSTLDGWWLEGHVEGTTGWEIPDGESENLYGPLSEIATLYYRRREKFREAMRGALSLNASFFNAQRMLHEYMLNAYR